MEPQKIGRYEIKAELGRGGMAVVYHGHDPRFKRDVAVKVLPHEMMHDPTFRARFEREAQTVAALEHSAIVPVYDFGEEDGQPYFVMRYMAGGSLVNRIQRGPLSLPDVATILARIGSALDSAHSQGVIHRDLKPSNILFDQYGDAFLADFGIVKLAEATMQLTGSHGLVGTPAYMAPELARPGGLSPLVDIYALGVTLFQMLTGVLPYQADTPMGVMMAHVTQPIPVMRSLRPDLPDEMQPIVERALAKDGADRYQRAGELAADLSRLVAMGQATQLGQQFHPAASPTAPTIDIPEPAVAEPSTEALPIRGATAQGAPLSASLEIVSVLQGHTNEALALAWSPDSKLLASGSADRSVIAWDPATGGELDRVKTKSDVQCLAFSPDGALLAAGHEKGEIVVWDLEDTLWTLKAHKGGVNAVDWSPDGNLLVSGSDDCTIAMYHWEKDDTLYTLDQHTDWVTAVAFSPDGAMFASGGLDGAVIVWRASAGTRMQRFEWPSGGIVSLAWSPDGAWLAAGSDDSKIVVWEVKTASPICVLEGHEQPVNVAWSPGGKWLVSGSDDGTVRLWDPKAGQQVFTVKVNEAGITGVAWSPDGKMLAAASRDHTVNLWKLHEDT